jgi:hypothetical protein
LAAVHLGEDPYELYNGPGAPPCPQPWRLKYFKYAMAEFAQDQDLRKHSAHPDQQDGGGDERGTEIRMPGGRVGFKKNQG